MCSIYCTCGVRGYNNNMPSCVFTNVNEGAKLFSMLLNPVIVMPKVLHNQ